jgi:hypothetical protein
MKSVLGQLVNNQVIRGNDSAGSGRFGSSRKRNIDGKWISIPQGHQGLDIITFPGQAIKSPISGKIVKVGKAYSDDSRFDTLHIQGDEECYSGIRCKLLYISSSVSGMLNKTVTRGEVIGVAQNISLKYKGATNHLHLEVFFNGLIQDPTSLFGPESCDAIDNSIAISEVANLLNQENTQFTAVEYIHHIDQPAQIEDLLSQEEFQKVSLDKNQLLQIRYEGRTNHRRLYEGLSITEKKKYNKGSTEYSPSANYPIVQGTTIFIPVKSVTIQSAYESNITVTKTVSTKYFAPILRELTNDPGFVPGSKNRGVDAKDIRPQLTVWLWSRTKYLESGGDDGFVDITKDIVSCNTGNTMVDGGNFTINLAPVITRLIEEQDSEGNSRSYWKKIDSDHYSDQDSSDSVSLGHINRERAFTSNTIGSEYVRNDLYYEKIIQQNDLVFISFEKLKIEGNDILNSVGGKWYDMIGLVDIVTRQDTASISDATISIRGRDLFKVLQDDNSYFNPYSIGHVNSLYGGELGSRFLQGEFKEISAIIPRSIRDSIEFIFHRIASIGYVPNDIFKDFTNKTQTTKTVKGEDKNVEKQVKGIWQLFKVFIDQSIQDLKVNDDSVANPNGSVLQIIRKICQQEFVEFFGDTYGDKYYLTCRKPPFTFDAVSQAVWNLDTVDEDFSSFQQEQQTPVGQATTQQKNRYAQREVRKQKEVDARQKTNDIVIDDNNDTAFAVQGLDEAVVTVSETYPRVININEDDIHTSNLQFTNEYYAWYKLTDKGNFAGNAVSLGHVPAIYFDEYAQIFGNRMLDVTNNYSNYNFFDHKEGEREADLYAEQASQLLSFLVESNIYLPFTRQGTITINGDRRIKKGHWIYYRPTKEFFYVTGVDHSIAISKDSIDRTTRLTVERGMVKSYIRNKPVTVTDRSGQERQIDVSYFNIVDIEKLKDGIYDVVTKGSASEKFDYKANMSLNVDVMDFFLQKRQFEQKYQYED